MWKMTDMENLHNWLGLTAGSASKSDRLPLTSLQIHTHFWKSIRSHSLTAGC